jgi:hypothetical protein
MLVARIAPNCIVLLLGTVIFVFSVFVVFPKVIHEFPSPGSPLIFAVISFFYVMWLWSWLTAALSDPGRVSEDLRRRGLLKRVVDGDVPPCLRNLQICSKCHLPKPIQCAHCDDCECCHLRQDHHCGLIGQCVADLNLKAFILSFLWGGALFIASAAGMIALALTGRFPWAGFFAVDALLFAGVMLAFAIGSVAKSREATSLFERVMGRSGEPLGLSAFVESFGSVWWERLIPVQRTSTFLAWPGITWESDAVPL